MGIYLEGLRKYTKNLGQDGQDGQDKQLLGRDSSREPHEYKLEV
jgi:hypothetical protein